MTFAYAYGLPSLVTHPTIVPDARDPAILEPLTAWSAVGGPATGAVVTPRVRQTPNITMPPATNPFSCFLAAIGFALTTSGHRHRPDCHSQFCLRSPSARILHRPHDGLPDLIT